MGIPGPSFGKHCRGTTDTHMHTEKHDTFQSEVESACCNESVLAKSDLKKKKTTILIAIIRRALLRQFSVAAMITLSSNTDDRLSVLM